MVWSPGVHPHEAKHWSPEAGAALEALAAEPEVVALGETGLDFNRNFSPKEDQIRAFTAQAWTHSRPYHRLMDITGVIVIIIPIITIVIIIPIYAEMTVEGGAGRSAAKAALRPRAGGRGGSAGHPRGRRAPAARRRPLLHGHSRRGRRLRQQGLLHWSHGCVTRFRSLSLDL